MLPSLSTRVRGGLSAHSLSVCTDRPPRTLVESDINIRCMYTGCPPEDEHLRLKTCRGTFMFMGPCIFIYEDHINNQRDANFYALYC